VADGEGVETPWSGGPPGAGAEGGAPWSLEPPGDGPGDAGCEPPGGVSMLFGLPGALEPGVVVGPPVGLTG